MPGAAPVQTSTLYWTGTGATASNFNFTTVSTSTPGSAGTEKVIAEYAVPYGTQLRFDGGRGFEAFLALNGASQMTAGLFIMCVTRQDGSRKILVKVPLGSFDTSANQKDVQKQVHYQSTIYAYGGLGEKVQLILDDGGAAFDGTETVTRIQIPYNYRITGK